MKTLLFGTAIAAVLAVPAGAQTTTITPVTSAAKVKLTVKPSLANAAKISPDSAYAIASRAADNGEVSSAELETADGRLVYEVQVLNKSKRETTVTVNAMTGTVIKSEAHGGLKATVLHHKENKKLNESKKDSAMVHP